jgi:hypothetical protein
MEEILQEISSKGYQNQIRVVTLNGANSYRIQNFKTDKIFDLLDFIRIIDTPEKIHIDKKVMFVNDTFEFEINFSDCIFEQGLVLRACKFVENVDFRHCTFNGRTVFKKSKFEKKVRFHNSEFNSSINFENTAFKDLVDFYYATFYSTQQFFLTDFLSVAIFSNVTFTRQIQFLYNKTTKDTIISFENATFQQSLDISRANFWCKLSFWKAEINSNPKEIWLYERDHISEKHIAKPIQAFKVLRETFRIIKDTFHKEGNQIESLLFYKYEMIIYEKEVKASKMKNAVEERISLFFNKNSNFFGTSWLRGLGFTFLVTLFFYTLFLFTFYDELVFDNSWNAISQTVKHFTEFLNIAKWDIKPFGINDYNWGYVALFIGRIFIAYGYYQIVQAFRKYGKS